MRAASRRSTSDTTDPKDDSLVDAFRAVGRRLRETSMDSLARWDLTPSQSRALITLARHGAARPSELSRHLRVAPRSITEVVDDLVAKDLVERAPDPGDRRATLVSLTDHGRQVMRQMVASRGADAERFFDRLSAADRAELGRILALLRD